MEAAIYILLAVTLVLVVMTAILLFRQRHSEERVARRILRDLDEEQRALRQELSDSVQGSVRNLGALLSETQRAAGASQSERLSEMQRGMSNMAAQLENRLKTSSIESEQKLENIRITMEKQLTAIKTDNNTRLDEMRVIVDEKLQKTLNERMTQSFQLVNERLEQVYKGLGEMQNLAVGVGDLKKVLSNVKTRGILGEIQLSAILEEILSPEQYVTNAATSSRGNERVEFAIKLPAEDGGSVLMPIDSKFPMDAYNELTDAYESGSPERVNAASEVLKARITSFGKDIHNKYIDPPNTTEFGIMFLPTEGLYAEAVKLGMMEKLQRDCRVTIAGPSTMAALLNSLQMGFRTVAIQKRSGEVWKVLSAVKTEFSRFAEVLEHTQKQLTRANEDLDKLIGVRTRRIQSSLKTVTELPESEANLYIAPESEAYAENAAYNDTENDTNDEEDLT